MEEILIDERKYISSKQAAKITGYAKDYVGQLCREGYIPARKVGRSWYVLESAIQDHRFGILKPDQSPVVVVEPAAREEVVERSREITGAWESPQYEPVQSSVTTSALKDEKIANNIAMSAREDTPNLNDAWNEWFKLVEERSRGAEVSQQKSDEVVREVDHEESPEPYTDVDERSVPVDFMIKAPTVVSEQKVIGESVTRQRGQAGGVRTRVLWVFQACAVLFACIAASLALLNSGYFDTYIASDERLSLLAGILVYKD